jgi:pimeloyl-ACP methyl ester carboxylesterase
MPMPYAVSGKVKIHYEVRGEGPPLLMLMGWQANRTWWPESLLSRLEPHAKLILMDHRGTGRSSDSRRLYSMADLARDALAVLDTEGIDRADVLGVSMGGMVAQELVLRFPRRVRNLILTSTSARPHLLQPLTREQRAAWMGYLKKRDRSLQEFLLDLLFSRDCKTDGGALIKNFVGRIKTKPTPQSTVIKQFFAIQLFNSRRRLKHISRPTLVVTGTNDLIIAPRHSHDLHRRIPHAHLHEVQGGSHAMLDAASEELANTFIAFLQRHPA